MTKEYQPTIDDLKSELAASMEREEQLRKEKASLVAELETLPKTIDPYIVRLYHNPNSMIGFILRLPRSCYRVIRHPSKLKEVFTRRLQITTATEGKSAEKKQEGSLFAPIQFFTTDSCEPRLNLIIPTLDSELLPSAIRIANHEKLSLRIVLTSESADPQLLNHIMRKKNLERPQKLLLYSSLDESEQTKTFRLEIGKQETILTTPWSEDVNQN